MAEAAPAGRSSPLVARRWLGSELVRLRTEADLTQRDVAAALQCSVAKISYLESGDRAVSPRELEDVLLDLYEVPAGDWEVYLNTAEIANQQGWWDHWSDEDLPREERRYVGLEDGATRLRAYLPTIVHGLLQLPDYTRAVLRAFKEFPEERIGRLVELRQQRKSVLSRDVSPIKAHFVVDEAVIRRQVGGPEIIRTQLSYMADTIEKRKNLTVQVLPFSIGAHGAHFGPFSILEFPSATDLGLVFVEGLHASIYLETRAEVYRHSTLFNQLSEMALGPDESLAMLHTLARSGGQKGPQ
jgi:transcriptional regulator with XRE-family HTH domain